MAAVIVTAAAVTLPGTASADQQSSVQAQIGALQSEVAAAGRQVHELTFAYTTAEVNVAALSQQVAVEEARAQQAAASLARSSSALRLELLEAYTGGFGQPSGAGGTAGTGGGTGAVAGAAATGGSVSDPAIRYGYISIATTGMHESVDTYRTARLQLSSALASLSAEERAARAAAASAGQARLAAISEAAHAESRLAGLQIRLAALQQQAAAPRAAASGTGSPAPPARTQGGPVNGGLVALVRAQVGAPAPQVTGSAAAPPSTLAPKPVPAVVPAAPAAPASTVPPTSAPVATTLPPSPVAQPAPAPPPSSSGGSADVWLQLRQCESGDDYQADTGNGFYGAYQFSQQTWTDLGYPGRPDLESPSMQDQAAQRLQAQSGWGQWPACAAALGLT